MRIIKVNATDSTNSFARDWFRNSRLNAPICIMAHEQLNGRGQRGASWQSKAGENLTFSIIFPELKLQINKQFLISAAVALAIYESLKNLGVKNLKIKWPNDIMAGNKKIGGILIENFLGKGFINASIIGVGLNVNQKEFIDLPHASSIGNLANRQYDLNELLEQILFHMEKIIKDLPNTEKTLIENYHKHLFKIKKPSTFKLPDNTLFTGVIEGVASSGKLLVRTEEALVKEFDIKEVKLCY